MSYRQPATIKGVGKDTGLGICRGILFLSAEDKPHGITILAVSHLLSYICGCHEAVSGGKDSHLFAGSMKKGGGGGTPLTAWVRITATR